MVDTAPNSNVVSCAILAEKWRHSNDIVGCQVVNAKVEKASYKGTRARFRVPCTPEIAHRQRTSGHRDSRYFRG
ncbi:hypothetical protein UVI_02050770 [Ustilaginoidea virens]|uniref:Uncharacterized protein n=1 Tax=Ustilaginoidea virens TaxID=1159556 RepID=A0A063BWA4_USTVR|nr:hypothetical protein UVI_02050770 [Ustilaginoidea virens]